jgi:hypothetical protein
MPTLIRWLQGEAVPTSPAEQTAHCSYCPHANSPIAAIGQAENGYFVTVGVLDTTRLFAGAGGVR